MSDDVAVLDPPKAAKTKAGKKAKKPATPKPKPPKKEGAKSEVNGKAEARISAVVPEDLFDKAACQDVSELLDLASDRTRLAILGLVRTPTYVGELCRHIGLAQPAVSHHLALLRTGRLIKCNRAGKNNFYELTDAGRLVVKAVTVLFDANRVR